MTYDEKKSGEENYNKETISKQKASEVHQRYKEKIFTMVIHSMRSRIGHVAIPSKYAPESSRPVP